MTSANVRMCAFLLVVGTLLAGCSRPDPSTSTPVPQADDSCTRYESPVFEKTANFSGENAFGHVLHLTCDFSRSPPVEAPRVPGTPGRQRAAQYIERLLSDAGWQVQRERFNGSEYYAYVAPGTGNGDDIQAYLQCRDDAARARRSSLTFENIVAQRGTGAQTLVLMAHYDSKRTADEDPVPANKSRPVLGANDGASGVAVIIEAARLIQPPPGFRVRLLLVDGEDGFAAADCHPLAGSIYHAFSMSQSELDAIRGVLLLDMVGDPEARFCIFGAAEAGGHDMRQRLVNASRKVKASAVEAARDCGNTIVDDHSAFLDRGVAAIDLIDYRGRFPPYWHTTHDTPDKVAPSMLGQVGRAVVEFVHGYA